MIIYRQEQNKTPVESQVERYTLKINGLSRNPSNNVCPHRQKEIARAL